jgi:pantetheine-phosphate adenylyltransferase
MPNVRIFPFEGLLVDFARKMKADLVIRGLRAITDFEYELQMAQTNHKLEPELETVFLTTSLEYSYLSSSTVKEVAAFGGDISRFVPEIVADRIAEKMKKKESVD